MLKFRNCFILLFYTQCAYIIVGLTSVSNDSAEDALNFIDEVQKKLYLTQNPNIILVIGNTGCGKSTLVHYVAGDYSKMFAEDPPNPNSVNYEIRDELDPDRDRITLATESRTLFPVISTDESHTVWVDSPGFGDTRNETVEIATTFLIKRVIENASNIKIVLVVNYDSVTKSNNRDDFDNLLSRAAELMKNIQRLDDSVSLVVTKAPSFKMRGRHYIDIFEDSIKNTTAQFMIDHRLLLEKKESTGNKVQLIDALLKGSNSISPTIEYYPRISIFWRPNEAGPFNKIEKMITGRRYIRESILNRSSYAEIQMNDFGFPLTPQAQIKVRNMVQHTVDSIKTTLKRNIDRLIVEMQQQIYSAETVKGRLEIINIGMNCIQTKTKGRAITFDLLSDQLLRLIRAYNISAVDLDKMDHITRNEKNLIILNSLIVIDEKSTDVNTRHKSSNLDYDSFLDQVIDFLNNKENEIQNGITQKAKETIRSISTILMNFDKQLLHALQRKIESIEGFQNRLKVLQLGKNSIQPTGKEITLKQRIQQLRNLTCANEITSINVSALGYIDRYEKSLNELKSLAGSELQLPVRDWIANSSNAINYQLSMYDWYLFLDESYQHFGEYESQNSSIPTINEISFDTIIRRVRRSADYESTPSKIIEMNDILNITMQSPTYECDNKTLTIKGHFVKSSNIRDALVTKCSLFDDLAIIKVFVLDTFYVDCDLYLNKTKEVELRILASKWNIRQNTKFYLDGINGENHIASADEGSAGKHGEPGANGGNFFGWANVIINGDWLNVELNGGRGGDGQDGMRSSDYRVTFDETGFSESGGWDSRTTDPDSWYLRYFREHGYNPELKSSTSKLNYWVLFAGSSNIWHTFILYPGRCCGSTGAGGRGGYGGGGGASNFILSSDEAKILPKIVSNDGKNGETGTNGRYCDTFKLRLSIFTKLDQTIAGYSFKNNFYDKQYLHYDKCPVRRGLVFQPGTPKDSPNRVHGPVNVVQSVIEYKSYLLANMNDPVTNIARKTYDELNSDPVINSAYKTLDFAMEANVLEQHFFELNKYIDVWLLYDDLLKRVEEFSVENETNLPNVDRKVLTLIYTMIFSKTIDKRSKHATDLIVNIGNFLDLTAQNVDELNEQKRIDVISEQRDEYNNVILAKIQEALNFIENDVNPEIEQTLWILNNELKNAADETVKLQSRTLHEIYVKEENLRIIRQNVIMRWVLNICESISTFAEAIFERFPPRTVAGIVKVTATTLKKHLVDPKIDKHEVPQSIQRLRNKMHKNNREKIEATEMELNKLIKSLQYYNVTNHELAENLKELIANAIKIKSEGSLEKVNNFIEKCIESLRWWQNVQDISNDENKLSIVRSIQRAQHGLSMIASSFPTYQQISSDDGDKISEVVQAIDKDREILEALKRFEDGIYFELMPMVDEMYEFLVNVEENLVNKSSVALDVMSWRIEKTLRNVQRKLIYELAVFDVESNINELMIRTNEVIKLSIDIYDRIQNYQKDSKLVTYLSELHTANLQHSDIHDTELKNILNDLEINLQTNLILGQYFRVLDAFKQVLFPYAADYLDAHELPSSLDENSTSLINRASQQIKSMSKKLKEYNDTVINEHDELIHSAHFDRGNGSRGPFYVWPNSEIRYKIDQLFNGKKVYLLADVQKSDTRNAVKFNKIELEFHSEDQAVNNKLNEILQSFHVSLTHMGNSNYRCNNTFYTIPSRPWSIKYSIGERNQSPADRNLVHSKLAAGSSLLSPYTLWAVQLLHGPFNELQPFINLTNIELHGFGLYVEENAPICETNLEKYYSIMISL